MYLLPTPTWADYHQNTKELWIKNLRMLPGILEVLEGIFYHVRLTVSENLWENEVCFICQSADNRQ